MLIHVYHQHGLDGNDELVVGQSDITNIGSIIIMMMLPQPIILVVHIVLLMPPLTLVAHNMETHVHNAIFSAKLALENVPRPQDIWIRTALQLNS